MDRRFLHLIQGHNALQGFGTRAKQAASALVFGKDVTLQTHGLDKYGRTIADVILPEGTNVNHELVKQVWCWWYRKYLDSLKRQETFQKQRQELTSTPL